MINKNISTSVSEEKNEHKKENCEALCEANKFTQEKNAVNFELYIDSKDEDEFYAIRSTN